MTAIPTRPFLAAVLLAAGFASTAPDALAQAGTGTRFRVTSKMEMVGMPFAMPAQTSEVCGPKNGGGESMVPKQDNCQVKNYRVSGNKSSYEIVCTGRDAMSGKGEFERLGPDAYRGKMTVNVEGQQMVMSFDGKRVGDCNYATESPQAQANAMIGKSCNEMLASGGKALIGAHANFTAPNALCASQKPAFCKLVTPLAGDLSWLRERSSIEKSMGAAIQGMSQWDTYQGCGLPRATVIAQACAKAETTGDFNFIGELCPARVAAACGKAEPNRHGDFLVTHCGQRADQLAAQHCTARSFTAGVTGPYAAFCNRYAARRLQKRNPGN